MAPLQFGAKMPYCSQILVSNLLGTLIMLPINIISETEDADNLKSTIPVQVPAIFSAIFTGSSQYHFADSTPTPPEDINIHFIWGHIITDAALIVLGKNNTHHKQDREQRW